MIGMPMPDKKLLLLDTCAIIWFFEGSSELSSQSVQLIDDAIHRNALSISAISLWEVAQLKTQNRVSLRLPVRDWLNQLVLIPGLNLLPITPEIASLSCELQEFHKDPPDRIIAATALIIQAKIVTRDRLMIKYPKLKNLVEPI